MNASEQALGLDITQKIASVLTLFKAQFPDAKADLKPWHNDPDTREWVDPDSIDIGFHFPGWSPRFQSRSILVQIRFFVDPLEKIQRFIGVEISGINHQGEAWKLSTIDQWQCVGSHLPSEEVRSRLKQFGHQVFELFTHKQTEK